MKYKQSYGWLAMVCVLGCKTAAPQLSWPFSTQSAPPAQTQSSVSQAVNTSEIEQSVTKSTASFQTVGYNQPNQSPIPPVVTQPQLVEKPIVEEQSALASPEVLPTVPPSQLPELQLSTVSQSVVASFPGLQIAMREFDIARGKEIAAWGEFDLKLKGESISAPEGFYENYRNLVKVEQATMPGGSVYGQYRIGDGNFPTWYGERETNEGGEFKIGFLASLLRDRAIDQRRASIFIAQLQQRQVDPAVQSLLLEFVLAASDAYWSWVAAGQSLGVQQNLLKLTEDRNKIYELRVQNKDLAPLELVQNQRLVAARQTKLTEAERKLQQSAIKLSFFYRDANGAPIIPTMQQLPPRLPDPSDDFDDREESHLQQALSQRPELQELQILRQQVSIDFQLAQNQYLPSVSAGLDASKDVGAAASSKKDKTPFELEAGLFVDVPYQRRKSIGKMREAQAKLRQLALKSELTSNKIVVQVRDARSAMITARQRVEQARVSRQFADQLVAGERLRFENKDSDLLRVAIQESTALEAAITEIEALADYHKARAAFDAAVGNLPVMNME